MIFYQIPSGGDRNYGYLIGCEKTKQTAVIDPSPNPEPCYEKAQELNLSITHVINTHTHSDHTGGNTFFISRNAKWITHESALSGNIRVKDGDTLQLGTLTLHFIHTPGHTSDSMCILVENNLITGDTLFVGKVGGTNSRETGETEFHSLKKLMTLNPEIKIWPGHNYGVRPSSTIGEELKSNPFILRLNDLKEFLNLKENWAAYKLAHGIA